MPGTPVKNAGTKIFISASAGASASVLIDGVSDISGFGVTRKEIDVTALSDKWRRRLKGLKDGGAIDISGQFRSDDRGQQYLAQAVNTEAPWGFQVQIPDSKGTANSTWTFFAQVMSYEPSSGKVDGVVEFKAQLLVDQSITFAAAS
jgi:predicted secreted protein